MAMPDGVAFVPSAAYGMSIAARNTPLARGQSVLVLDDQFPSSVLPWRQRCDEAGAQLVVVRRADGQDWTDAVLHALASDPGIHVLVLPQAHWRDGALLDLDRIAVQVHAREARLVLDLSQSLGVLPVRLDAWRPGLHRRGRLQVAARRLWVGMAVGRAATSRARTRA